MKHVTNHLSNNIRLTKSVSTNLSPKKLWIKQCISCNNKQNMYQPIYQHIDLEEITTLKTLSEAVSTYRRLEVHSGNYVGFRWFMTWI